MDRLACVDLPSLSLQLLLARHPEWAELPAAVVAEDRPQALVLRVNEAARAAQVFPGQRYAAALSLAPELRAGVVPPHDIEATVAALTIRLQRFSPRVEPAADGFGATDPDVFWLDASGLERLHGSLAHWAESLHVDLGSAGFIARIAVGFTRFGTYATAKAQARAGVILFGDPAEEDAAARAAPLDRLPIDPAMGAALRKLCIRTVGDLVRLPARGLLERFGPEAHLLHRLAAGDLCPPLAAHPMEETFEDEILLDFAESDATRHLFLAKRLLDPLLARLAARGEGVAELRLRRTLERGRGPREDSIRPAAPTLDALLLLDLLRLRLEGAALPAPVAALHLAVRGAPIPHDQLRVFAEERPRRDPHAADRALARLRAELGDGAVVRARLLDGHLPETQFAWEVLEQCAVPRPSGADGAGASRFLVRRICDAPHPLPPRPRHEPDGWLVRGIAHGPVLRLIGPYVLRGGWWAGEEVHREYHFAETQRGELLWIFYDRARRRWFLHGRVE